MAKRVQFRRGTSTQHNSFTGAVGEITVDTTKDTAVVHDGSTVGGFPLLRESAYTADDVLTKIKTVDGSGSGLDADLLGGKNAADTGVNTIVQRNASGNALALGAATGTSFNSITGLASVAPLMDGTATVGTSPLVARQDHIHPSDTSKINTADIMMAIGNINSPLLDMPLKNSLAMKAGVGSATFTRASTATYVDRYGVLKNAAIDEPRFEKEGYLNEGASTNLWTYSGSENYVSWPKDPTYTTLTVDGLVVTPSNIAGAMKVTSSDVVTTNYRNIHKSTTISSYTANSYYTASAYVKVGSGGKLRFRFGHSGGYLKSATITIDGNFTVVAEDGATVLVKEIGNGWYIISATMTHTSDLTDLNCTTQMANTTASSNVNYFYIDCMQLEALPFATSYIPTTSASVTRASDILSVTYENNAPDNTEDVSYVVDANCLGTNIGSNQCVFEKNYALFNLLRFDGNSDSAYVSAYLSSSAVQISMTGSSISKMNRFAIVVYKDGTKHTGKMYRSGVEKNSLTGFTYKNTNADIKVIGLGTRANLTSDRLYGHISNFRIYDKALSSQEIALA